MIHYIRYICFQFKGFPAHLPCNRTIRASATHDLLIFVRVHCSRCKSDANLLQYICYRSYAQFCCISCACVRVKSIWLLVRLLRTADFCCSVPDECELAHFPCNSGKGANATVILVGDRP